MQSVKNANIMPIQTNASLSNDPWYKHRWPWIIISIPLCSVILGGVMLYLAFSSDDSLVVDDYYQQGKSINQRIERDKNAALLGVGASVKQAPDGAILSLHLVDQASMINNMPDNIRSMALQLRADYQLPETLEVRWVHSTLANMDGVAVFQKMHDSEYVAPNVSLPGEGLWRLHITPNQGDWRLVSEVQNNLSEKPVSIGSHAWKDYFLP